MNKNGIYKKNIKNKKKYINLLYINYIKKLLKII